MSKDVEKGFCFSLNSRSFIWRKKTPTVPVSIWTALFLLTSHTLVVRAETYSSPRLDDGLTIPRQCNREYYADSRISEGRKQEKRYLETLSADQAKANFKCLISVETAHEDWKRGTNLLVDVRDEKAFDRNKIPGSTNLPLYTLKFKKSLQKRKIVLLNKGVHLSSLDRSCLELKALGFNHIFVMLGGLKTWSDAGYPVAGAKMTGMGFSTLTASEFVGVINERDWAFIDLDHSSKELRNLLSTPSVVEYSEDFSILRGKMDAFKAARKPGVLAGFLVVSQDGNSNGTIKRRLQDLGIKDVYYLSGGVSGFKRYMQEHASRIERLRKGFQVRMGCNG